MNRLNAGAYEFVPGRAFIPPQPPQQPLPPPIERPEATEAPRPAPTISLNIGGSKPPPPPAAATPPPAAAVKPADAVPAPAAPAPTTPAAVKVKADSAPSKTFSMEKAKMDTAAIAQEVQTAADRAVLEDLYGQCKVLAAFLTFLANKSTTLQPKSI